jgi:hypothetical protein
MKYILIMYFLGHSPVTINAEFDDYEACSSAYHHLKASRGPTTEVLGGCYAKSSAPFLK